MSKVVVFLFHRDLRLEDNIPLQQALDFAKEHDCAVLPLFIFTPQQVGTKAVVKSAASVSCLIQSVVELDEELKKKYKSGLCILYDETVKALEKINEPNYSNIKAAIYKLADNPRPKGFKKLKGREGYRIRVADYRIIYAIFDDILVVDIIDLGHRKEVYD